MAMRGGDRDGSVALQSEVQKLPKYDSVRTISLVGSSSAEKRTRLQVKRVNSLDGLSMVNLYK